jgi:phospholipid/cholesterol/gamma-HCH transport system substrate-binding protein
VRNFSLIGRVAAIGALVIAVVVVAVILLSSGSSYSVKADFVNASQLVSGDAVEVSGTTVGTVSNIAVTPDGQAQVTLAINNSSVQPLRRGTLATVREPSLSGIANRYVDLRLAPQSEPAIPDHGTIPTSDTTSSVDIDELFNTLNAPTRKALQELIVGSAKQYKGEAARANAAFAYLNPAIASTSMLFEQLNKDTSKFTRFIVKSGNLVSTIAQRQSDLSALIAHLATTTEALASQRTALGNSIQRLPGFMTLADTTFANLRTSLGVLTPLVNVTKPVAPKLQELLTNLKPFAQNSVPTIRNLAKLVSKPGPNNDLIDLTRQQVPLAKATVDTIQADGKLRPGAFPESTKALNDSTPEIAVDRPYAVDLTGWFEGFSHPGGIDAYGNYSRVAPVIGLASINNGLFNILPSMVQASLRQLLDFGGSQGSVVTNQGDRCPGSMERGALYYPYQGYPCSPNEIPTGK